MMMENFSTWITHHKDRAALVGLAAGALLLLGALLLPDPLLKTLFTLALGGVMAALAASLYALRRFTTPLFTPNKDVSPQEVQQEFAHLVTHIHVTSDGLVRAAEAINHVTAQQSDGASQQADTIQLTNKLLEDFLSLSERIQTQAQQMTENARQASDVSQSGQSAIRQAIEGMDTIRTQVSAIGETIVKLAALTRRIDEIITSVSEIATQSNLLSLNASIEAARAGTHGRGFAIVADEVRSLSKQSTQAAKQVRSILVEIQTAIKDTIRATESGSRGVVAGVMMTQQVNHVLVELARSVEMSQEATKAIYEVIRQQAAGLEEISISMDRIERITQQNLASTRMVETVSSNLTRLASELQSVVEQSEIIATPLPK